MKAGRLSLILSVFILTTPATTLRASAKLHLDSRWRTADIAVDGKQDDWPSALTPLGDQPISVDVVNDGTFLYLRLTASDPGTRMQILRQGLIVWFDGSGGTKKKLGIRYPFVQRGSGEDNGSGRGGYGGYGGGRRPRGGSAGGDRAEPDTFEPPEDLEILGPGKSDARMLMRDHAQGVEVALQVDRGTVVYELKVPLAKNDDHPYAIDATAGKTIGIGFETLKMERQTPEGGRRGGFGGGGFGGGMGRRGGGMGRPRGGSGGEREFQPPKPIKVWGTLKLASSAS